MTIEIGKKYIMHPPVSKKGVNNEGVETTIVEKADAVMKQKIDSFFPHHANGMDWYKISKGTWGREDWFEEVK